MSAWISMAMKWQHSSASMRAGSCRNIGATRWVPFSWAWREPDHCGRCLGGVAPTPHVTRKYVSRRGPIRGFDVEPGASEHRPGSDDDQVGTDGVGRPHSLTPAQKRHAVLHGGVPGPNQQAGDRAVARVSGEDGRRVGHHRFAQLQPFGRKALRSTHLAATVTRTVEYPVRNPRRIATADRADQRVELSSTPTNAS
jgi:hypothetical protein